MLNLKFLSSKIIAVTIFLSKDSAIAKFAYYCAKLNSTITPISALGACETPLPHFIIYPFAFYRFTHTPFGEINSEQLFIRFRM